MREKAWLRERRKFNHRDHKVIHRGPQSYISHFSQSVKISIDHKKSVLISFICVGQSPDWCFNVDKRLKDEPILLINERVPHSERGAQCEGLPQAYFTVPSSLRTA